MSFSLNADHYEIFLNIATETGWPSARKPQRWARHIGATDEHSNSISANNVDRIYLKDLCADASISSEACFLAIMAWGGMKTDHGAIAWALRDKWLPLVDTLRTGNLSRSESYAKFHEFRTANPRCGFGPAYYTKLIFFCSPSHDGYIMDQWTARSINLIMPNGGRPMVDLNAVRNKGQISYYVSDRNGPDVFERFCQAVEFLAAQSELAATNPEEVEMRMFAFGGQGRKPPAKWRQYVISQPQP
jgi:hypothetical protein